MTTAPRYVTDEGGAPFTLAELKEANRDAPLSASDMRALRALRPGKSLHLGGGAQGVTTITRVGGGGSGGGSRIVVDHRCERIVGSAASALDELLASGGGIIVAKGAGYVLWYVEFTDMAHFDGEPWTLHRAPLRKPNLDDMVWDGTTPSLEDFGIKSNVFTVKDPVEMAKALLEVRAHTEWQGVATSSKPISREAAVALLLGTKPKKTRKAKR